MNVQDVINIISTVGFPIACCIAMMWYVKYVTDANREEIARLNEQHKNESSNMTEAINNNTVALQKLCDLMKTEGV